MFIDIIKLTAPNAVLTLQATDIKSGQKITHNVALRPVSGKFNERYAVFGKVGDFPKMKLFFYTQDTLQIRSLQGSRKQLSVYRYSHDFDPALSPMATSGKNVPKTWMSIQVLPCQPMPCSCLPSPAYIFSEKIPTL
jgi:hypothetical protein